MIYFLKHDATGLIKIGSTDNWDARCYQLTKQYGDLMPLGFMRGDIVIERRLHKVFSDIQVLDVLDGREWFSPNAELLNYIRMSCESEPIMMALPISIEWQRVTKEDMANANSVEITNLLPSFFESVIKQTGMTQAKIAFLLGIDSGYMSNVINGKRGQNLVNCKLIGSICRVFGVKPNDILVRITA